MLYAIMKRHDKKIASSAASDLVRESGGLPLAIRQIASYICATHLDPGELLKDYIHTRHASTIDEWDESAAPGHTYTLATFLRFSFEKLNRPSLLIITIFHSSNE